MTAHPIPAVQNAGYLIADHMDAILKFFKPGAKITILVRRPERPDGAQDFVLTNDAIDAAIAALEHRKFQAKTLTGDV